MKIAPVSGDLLVKLAIGAGLLGVVVWATRSAVAALPSPQKMWDTATDAARGLATRAEDPLDPVSVITYGGPLNPIARVVAPLASLWEGYTSNTYDGRSAEQWDVTPTYGGGTYNNPSAYSADTGAAFGIYPKP